MLILLTHRSHNICLEPENLPVLEDEPAATPSPEKFACTMQIHCRVYIYAHEFVYLYNILFRELFLVFSPCFISQPDLSGFSQKLTSPVSWLRPRTLLNT